MTHIACKTNLRSVVRFETVGRIHAKDTGRKSGVLSCIMTGLPTHLVQGLNASTLYARMLEI